MSQDEGRIEPAAPSPQDDAAMLPDAPLEGKAPRGFAIGLILTIAAYVLGFFVAIRMENGFIVVGVALAVILFVGFSMPQLGGSPGRYFLGVGVGLASAFLLFAVCALLVISMLGG